MHTFLTRPSFNLFGTLQMWHNNGHLHYQLNIISFNNIIYYSNTLVLVDITIYLKILIDIHIKSILSKKVVESLLSNDTHG